jgi:Na+-translocating ferredoxin:NAD+ oxidoreductase subunit G
LKNNRIYLAALVFLGLIAAVFLLNFAENITRDRVKFLEDQQTLEILSGVFPDVSFYSYEEESEIYTVYNSEKNKMGYAFYAQGMGAEVPMTEGGRKVPGPIVILVGLEDKETIKSIVVISHSETSWYWDSLLSRNYLEQFSELKIDDCYFKRDGGKVDVVTGATLSSVLVLNTVREAAIEKAPLVN